MKENYNPVQEGIMSFHSDMNALRSDIDEIIEGIKVLFKIKCHASKSVRKTFSSGISISIHRDFSPLLDNPPRRELPPLQARSDKWG